MNTRLKAGWLIALLASLAATACSGAASPTPTPTVPPPTSTPLPPTATPEPTPTPTLALPTVAATPEPLPEYTQAFAVSFEGELFGNVDDLGDGKIETWASLHGGGYGIWIFDLGSEMQISAVKFWPVVDTGDGPYVNQVDVSSDGQTWTGVFSGSDPCGAPDCNAFPPNEWSELKFAPAVGRYVRMIAGPRWLALAEVEIEVQPLAP